jgi:hypothetical protein
VARGAQIRGARLRASGSGATATRGVSILALRDDRAVLRSALLRGVDRIVCGAGALHFFAFIEAPSVMPLPVRGRRRAPIRRPDPVLTVSLFLQRREQQRAISPLVRAPKRHA